MGQTTVIQQSILFFDQIIFHKKLQFFFLQIVTASLNQAVVLSVVRTEHVAKTMIELIEKGANGAVWVSQHGDPPIEIQLPKYEMITL